MKKLLILLLLLLVLSSCETSKYDILNDAYIRGDYVEKIASENNFKDDYIFTIQPAYNCEYEDAYIITFYNHTIINELVTTYLAYRIGDTIYYEVMNNE